MEATAALGVAIEGGGPLAFEIYNLLWAGAGLVVSFDDLTESPEGNSFLELLTEELGGEDARDFVEGAKFAVNMKHFGKGVVEFTFKFDGKDVVTAFDIYNEIILDLGVVVGTKSVLDSQTEKTGQ